MYNISKIIDLLSAFIASDQVLVFDWIAGSCQVNFDNRAGLFGSLLTLSPGLKFIPILTFSRAPAFSSNPIQIFFECMAIIKLKTEIYGQTVNRKPHRKVTKLK